MIDPRTDQLMDHFIRESDRSTLEISYNDICLFRVGNYYSLNFHHQDLQTPCNPHFHQLGLFIDKSPPQYS